MKIFSEEQKFDQWWFRILIIAVMVVIIGSTIPLIFTLEDMDTTVIVTLIATNILTAAILVFIGFFLKLETRIDEIGIHYSFYPIQRKHKTLNWHDIAAVYVRKYNAVAEYGGWGYRITFGKNGKAFNVKGNLGIQIILKNDKKLLIGTQKEQEAQQTIERYFQKKNKENDY